jgi:large subunit ribosomal protein L9
MKVILLQELKGQGGEGDVVDVKRGFAVNYLFPRKIALEATKGNLKQLELRKHNIAKREATRLDSAEKVLAALDGKTLVMPARVGEEGQLFGSVTTQQIADKLLESYGIEIDRKKIDLHAPIKTVGEHSATISIYRDAKAVLTVEVVDEHAEAEAAAEVVATEIVEEIIEEAVAEEIAAEVVAEEIIAEIAEQAAEETDYDRAVEADADNILEQADQAFKVVANKLIQAADSADDEDVDPEASAQAAVEVLKEVEQVLDATIVEVLEDADADAKS